MSHLFKLIAFVLILAGFAPSALAQTGAPAPGPAPAPTSATWEVKDSAGNPLGIVTGDSNPSGGWTYRYYAYPPPLPEEPTDTGAVHAIPGSDGFGYTWASNDGINSGEIHLDPSDPDQGEWTNTHTNQHGTMRKL